MYGGASTCNTIPEIIRASKAVKREYVRTLSHKLTFECTYTTYTFHAKSLLGVVTCIVNISYFVF